MSYNKGNEMLGKFRHQKIYEMVRQHGSVNVTELTSMFNVSDMTIRRDLTVMDKQGLLRRVYGGAINCETKIDESLLSPQTVPELDRKIAIAHLARELVRENHTIYIGGGSTCHEFAKTLYDASNITVVTDSLQVVRELQPFRAIQVIVLGGMLQADGIHIGGPLALEIAEKISVDTSFFSGGGFTIDTIDNPTMIGVDVKRALLKNAARRVFLADSTKFNHKAFYELCPTSMVNVLITDSGLSPAQLKPLTGQGAEIKIAEMT